MSRPSRGVVARRREGGAGCGTRERGQRKATSPGGGGEPSRGTKTAGRSDRSVEGVKPELPRGAPNGGAQRYSASDPQATGRPGAIRAGLGVIQVTRRFGAPFPSFGGRENRRNYGRTPAPEQEQGPVKPVLFDGVDGPYSRHRCARTWPLLERHKKEEPSMREVGTIAFDLSKHVFQVHGVTKRTSCGASAIATR